MLELKEAEIITHALGIATRHTPDFRFDRPNGELTMSLLMCFRTPAIVLTESGLVQVVPGDCLIHSPCFPLLHYSVHGAKDGFRNDWLYARADIVRTAMETAGLTWNTPISTGHPDIFEDGLRRLMHELSSWDDFSKAAAGAVILMMLLGVARALREGRDCDMRRLPGHNHFDILRVIRAKALAEFRHPWTVKAMAHEACLSQERFSTLYRTFFGQSPIHEIIDARMCCASRLLCYSGLPVKEIALECGFEDCHYFSRLFKRRNGVSPLEWRYNNKILGGGHA